MIALDDRASSSLMDPLASKRQTVALVMGEGWEPPSVMIHLKAATEVADD